MNLNIFKKNNKPTPSKDTASKEDNQKKENPHDNGGCCGHCGGQDK